MAETPKFDALVVQIGEATVSLGWGDNEISDRLNNMSQAEIDELADELDRADRRYYSNDWGALPPSLDQNRHLTLSEAMPLVRKWYVRTALLEDVKSWHRARVELG